MKYKTYLPAIGLAVALLAGVASPAAAFGTCGDPTCTFLLILGITEDPDPIGMWGPVGDLPPFQEAHPTQGVVDIDFDRDTGWPVVVWQEGYDAHQTVVYTEWGYDGWLGVDHLSDPGRDALDPRVNIGPDGMRHVVWWEDTSTGAGKIVLTSLNRSWKGNPRVVAPAGRRPSVVGLSDRLLIAYERDSPNDPNKQQIIVQTRFQGGPGFNTVLAETEWSQPLNIKLRSDSDDVWIEWQHSAAYTGYAEFRDGIWGIEDVPDNDTDSDSQPAKNRQPVEVRFIDN